MIFYSSVADVLTDNLPQDVSEEINEAFDTLSETVSNAVSELGNNADAPDEVSEIVSRFQNVLRNIIYFLSDYYLVFGIVMVSICVIIAVFSRKNKKSRRKAIIGAVIIPAFCFACYIGGFIYCDLYVDGMAYKTPTTEAILSLPNNNITDQAYQNMYRNAIENYAKYGIRDDRLSFNARSILGALFVSEALVFAGASFLFGMLIQLVAVKDIDTKKWGLVGLGIVIPFVLLLGYFLYTGNLRTFFI
jgi:hypothetical protein